MTARLSSPDNHNAILPMFSSMAREPEKKYRTIVADPPWSYRAKNGAPNAKGPEGQYRTSSLARPGTSMPSTLSADIIVCQESLRLTPYHAFAPLTILKGSSKTVGTTH